MGVTVILCAAHLSQPWPQVVKGRVLLLYLLDATEHAAPQSVPRQGEWSGQAFWLGPAIVDESGRLCGHAVASF